MYKFKGHEDIGRKGEIGEKKGERERGGRGEKEREKEREKKRKKESRKREKKREKKRKRERMREG